MIDISRLKAEYSKLYNKLKRISELPRLHPTEKDFTGIEYIPEEDVWHYYTETYTEGCGTEYNTLVVASEDLNKPLSYFKEKFKMEIEEDARRKMESANQIQRKKDAKDWREYKRLKEKFEKGSCTDEENPVSLQQYEVWMEGHIATGSSSKAELLGVTKAENFRGAVHKVLEKKGMLDSYFNPEKLTYWACKLYDNEAEARKGFG